MHYLKILITSLLHLTISCGYVAAADMNRIGEHAIVAKGMQVDNVTSLGGNITVEGVVLKDAVSIGGDVIVTSTGKINRNAVSIGGSVITHSGAIISGERVTFENVPGIAALGNIGMVQNAAAQFQRALKSTIQFLKSIYWLNTSLLLLALGYLAVYLVPERVVTISRTLATHYGKCSVIGLVVFLTVLPLAIMSGISVIGIPLVPLILATLSVSVLLGWVSLGLLVGRLLPFNLMRESDTFCALSGLVLLTLIGAVPILGLLLISVSGLMSVGAVFLSKFGSENSVRNPDSIQR
jgi:hypothetical protein